MKPTASKRKTYPSDVSREQFEAICADLEDLKDLERWICTDVFCGVLYVLKSGCQRRMVPSDLPPWGSVYSYYSTWSLHFSTGWSTGKSVDVHHVLGPFLSFNAPDRRCRASLCFTGPPGDIEPHH